MIYLEGASAFLFRYMATCRRASRYRRKEGTVEVHSCGQNRLHEVVTRVLARTLGPISFTTIDYYSTAADQ